MKTIKQTIINANQKKIIPILLGDPPSHPRPSVFPAKAGIGMNSSEDRILDPFENTQGKLVENDNRIDIILAGENAEVEIWGLLTANGQQQTALEVYITHAAPNTKSNVNVRAVLTGKSSFTFRGNVKIEKGAKGADAYLRSDALLFDDAKMGDDTPALEILEKDVKAGHAATIGKVDENMLFYLMSRGLSRNQAEKLLIKGFISPILEKIKHEQS